ncbi:NVEALA domain-containing protein [uncultured Phocaeicola sp.]|uniref:NVEALA domain-containing protein n=1 Tax=uncultured Phocaeicola sp. TaxID=990718 RepID=UPI00338EBA70
MHKIKEELSDLALENIEALAGNESGTNTSWSCRGSVNRCHAKCGLCGTEIGPSKGTLTGRPFLFHVIKNVRVLECAKM